VSLKPDETELTVNWIKDESRVIADPIEARIGHLIAHDLQKIAASPESGGWEILYRDPVDGRYWELTHPHSEMHGGGPRRLTNLPATVAARKCRLADGSWISN
jgi:Immunity protein 27